MNTKKKPTAARQAVGEKSKQGGYTPDASSAARDRRRRKSVTLRRSIKQAEYAVLMTAPLLLFCSLQSYLRRITIQRRCGYQV
jgi:hypothetical protein